MYFPESEPGPRKIAQLLAQGRVVKLIPKGEEWTKWTCHVQVGYDEKCGLPILVQLPHHYGEAINAFVWREQALWLVLQFKEELCLMPNIITNFSMVLAYMDAILCRLAEEASHVKEEDRTQKWRCKVFDDYLAIEFYVSRHEPRFIRDFRRKHDLNIDCVNVAEIGQNSRTFQS